MEVVWVPVLGLVIIIGAFFGGGLIYLGAVWLHAHKDRPGLYSRYSQWVIRKEQEIEAKARQRG